MSFYQLSPVRKSNPNSKPLKIKISRDAWFLLAGVLATTFLGFLLGAFYTYRFFSENSLLLPMPLASPGKPVFLEPSDSSFPDYEEAVVSAVRRASPAVVSIIISKDMPVFEEFLRRERFGPFEIEVPDIRQKGVEKREIGGGTGFIVSKDGLILTNKHVVLDTQAEYTVLTNQGERFTAAVLGRDPSQDIAFLKIENPTDLPVVKLGDSDSLQIGQTVITIGNVLGEFRNSVSVGVISGLSRTIQASSGGRAETLEDVIQTDAAINQGNSGGPLLNLKGEVIGINTAMVLGAENIGFAIPVNYAKRGLESIKQTGKIVYPFLGVYYTIITPALAREHDLTVDYGAWVGRDDSGQAMAEAVFKDSPAEQAGLKRDDIILEFAGQKISRENTLAEIILKHNPGDEIALKIWRGEEEIMVNAVLAERTE